MSTDDHNKTLVILHSLVAVIFTAGLVASPWIIAKNFKHAAQVPTAIVVFGTVFVIAMLFWFTVWALLRRKLVAKRLALVAALVLLPIFWPLAVYTWWFMHTEGAKRIYQAR